MECTYATIHMKNVAQNVRLKDATAYVHNKMIEHSLSPASSSCVIVPATISQAKISARANAVLDRSSPNLVVLLEGEIDMNRVSKRLQKLLGSAKRMLANG